MGQHYTSFLVRCWRLGGDQRRIKVEHVQSGAETQVTSLAAALAWLETCWQELVSDSSGRRAYHQRARRGHETALPQ